MLMTMGAREPGPQYYDFKQVTEGYKCIGLSYPPVQPHRSKGPRGLWLLREVRLRPRRVRERGHPVSLQRLRQVPLPRGL